MGAIKVRTSVEFKTIECCNCGVTFAVTDTYADARRDDHRGFHCPNGHSLSYRGKSKAEQLEEKLAAERARVDQARADAEFQKKRAAGIQGELTKTKKRVAGGACPCCNRTFVNLGRHMAGQHPGYAGDGS